MSAGAFLTNFSPFAVEHFVMQNPHGQESLLVVISATFMVPDGIAMLAEAQQPIQLADVPRSPHPAASVRSEGDLALVKPRVDVLFDGCAYARLQRPATEVLIGLRIGEIVKTLRVTGDRFWRRGALGRTPSSPREFERMPIQYERAFGGSEPADPDAKPIYDPHNPAGVGYRGARSIDPATETEIANVEYVDETVTNPAQVVRPAGLGVVARGWQPRIALAGTYDANWLAHRSPLLPEDFDPRHYQAAPEDQQCGWLRGGESVSLVNLTASGEWLFKLPVLDVPVGLYCDRTQDSVHPRLDTIILDGESRSIRMVARLSRRTDRRAPIREIVVGHPSAAWLRARATRKRFVDLAASGGSAGASAHFRISE